MEKTYLHAFEKDGIIYPPIEAECANCFYSESKTVGFDFGGEVIRCYCYHIGEFVDDQPPCVNHELSLSKVSSEQEEEYWRLEGAGELESEAADEDERREIQEFLALD
jgi:hypothetical protein